MPEFQLGGRVYVGNLSKRTAGGFLGLLMIILINAGIILADENDYAIRIHVQTVSNLSEHLQMIWETAQETDFKKLAGFTVFIMNTATREVKTLFLIRDLNKDEITQEDTIVNLGAHKPGEYEVRVGSMMENSQVSNKSTYTIRE